ncbi:MAG TPA: hypothetical protein P5179_09680 [Candidatus Latescibacteria bacterium]|nr:hypothetical protein [Candidatus Latescibacterota bacterium]
MRESTRGWSEQQWEDYFARQDESFFLALRSRTSREQPTNDVQPSPETAGTMDDLLATASADTLLEEEDALIRELYAGLGQMPAWRAVVEFCDRTMEFVAPICENVIGSPLESVTRILCRECFLVADYVLAGHELGYDEETLCGNIALCLRARRSLDRCIQCLDRFGPEYRDACLQLRLRGKIAGVFLERRVSDLRARVWWR